MDVAIAALNNDGQNVIMALQARRAGIGKVVAIVQEPE